MWGFGVGLGHSFLWGWMDTAGQGRAGKGKRKKSVGTLGRMDRKKAKKSAQKLQIFLSHPALFPT